MKMLTFLIFSILGIALVSAIDIEPDLHVNILDTDTSDNILTNNEANYTFNVTSDSGCSTVLYTNSTNLTSDKNGIISHFIDGAGNLDYSQQLYLCIYKDDTLITVKPQIANSPYAFFARNTTWQGVKGRPTNLSEFTDDINTNSSNSSNYWDNHDTPSDINLDDLGDTDVSSPSTNDFIRWTGAIWQKVALFATENTWSILQHFTGGINVTGDADIDGNLNVTGNVSFSGNITGDLDMRSSSDFLNWSERTVGFNDSLLQTTIDARIVISKQVFKPTLVTVDVGTLDSGDVDSLKNLSDGDSLNVSEVVGTPGFEIVINYTNVTEFVNIQLHEWYDGSTGHQVDVELYNYNTNTYDDFGDLEDETEFMLRNFVVADSTNYIENTNASLRIRHADPGNVNHDVFIDYAVLQKTAQETRDHGSLTGLNEDDHSQYLLVSGARSLTGNWSNPNANISASHFFGDGSNLVGVGDFYQDNFTEAFDNNFSSKDTDDLTEGTTNFYDNRSFNQTFTDGIYYNMDGDTITEDMNFSIGSSTMQITSFASVFGTIVFDGAGGGFVNDKSAPTIFMLVDNTAGTLGFAATNGFAFTGIVTMGTGFAVTGGTADFNNLNLVDVALALNSTGASINVVSHNHNGTAGWGDPVPHKSVNVTADRAFDTNYNNTSNRPIRIEVSARSSVQENGDTAYMEGYAALERHCIEGIIQVGITGDVFVDTHEEEHFMNFVVQPYEIYSVNTTINNLGTLSLSEWWETDE